MVPPPNCRLLCCFWRHGGACKCLHRWSQLTSSRLYGATKVTSVLQAPQTAQKSRQTNRQGLFRSCCCRAGAEGAYPLFWRPWFDPDSTSRATGLGSVAAGAAAVGSFPVSRRLVWHRLAQRLQGPGADAGAKLETFGQFARATAPWCAALAAEAQVLNRAGHTRAAEGSLAGWLRWERAAPQPLPQQGLRGLSWTLA